jgi:hypothetical protein
MANGKPGIVAWLTDHWLLSAAAVGAGVFFLSKRASAAQPAGAAAVLASVPPAQQPAIQTALNAGTPPEDIASALNAGVAPAIVAAVAIEAQVAGGDVADRILAFVATHPDATDAEIQAAVSGRHILPRSVRTFFDRHPFGR